jgi:hypothetical protein
MTVSRLSGKPTYGKIGIKASSCSATSSSSRNRAPPRPGRTARSRAAARRQARSPGRVHRKGGTERAGAVMTPVGCLFAGSAQRIWHMTWVGRPIGLFVTVPTALTLIAAVWAFVVCWYLVWGLWLVPYRLIRRVSAKRSEASASTGNCWTPCSGASSKSGVWPRFDLQKLLQPASERPGGGRRSSGRDVQVAPLCATRDKIPSPRWKRERTRSSSSLLIQIEHSPQKSTAAVPPELSSGCATGISIVKRTSARNCSARTLHAARTGARLLSIRAEPASNVRLVTRLGPSA